MSVLRKPLVSLARMILWSQYYSEGDTPIDVPIFRPGSESDLELQAARAAVEVILSHNNINMEDIRPKDFIKYEWLAQTEVGEDWKDPGVATLTVPDVRNLFRAFEDTVVAQ